MASPIALPTAVNSILATTKLCILILSEETLQISRAAERCLLLPWLSKLLSLTALGVSELVVLIDCLEACALVLLPNLGPGPAWFLCI